MEWEPTFTHSPPFTKAHARIAFHSIAIQYQCSSVAERLCDQPTDIAWSNLKCIVCVCQASATAAAAKLPARRRSQMLDCIQFGRTCAVLRAERSILMLAAVKPAMAASTAAEIRMCLCTKRCTYISCSPGMCSNTHTLTHACLFVSVGCVQICSCLCVSRQQHCRISLCVPYDARCCLLCCAATCSACFQLLP